MHTVHMFVYLIYLYNINKHTGTFDVNYDRRSSNSDSAKQRDNFSVNNAGY